MSDRGPHERRPKALRPFSRALAVHDALPDRYRPSDDTPLRECLAGVWPTVADLRALVEWGASTPSPATNLDGYADAFYEIARLLDISPQSRSPKDVWECEMLPRLRAALAATATEDGR